VIGGGPGSLIGAAHRAAALHEPLALKFPNGLDEVIGLRFLETGIESSDADGAWTSQSDAPIAKVSIGCDQLSQARYRHSQASHSTSRQFRGKPS